MTGAVTNPVPTSVESCERDPQPAGAAVVGGRIVGGCRLTGRREAEGDRRAVDGEAVGIEHQQVDVEGGGQPPEAEFVLGERQLRVRLARTVDDAARAVAVLPAPSTAVTVRAFVSGPSSMVVWKLPSAAAVTADFALFEALRTVTAAPRR